VSESQRLFIVAAERSGDLLGAGLIRELKAQSNAPLALAGVGGAAMAEEGVVSAFDISELSILGLVEGLMAYRRVVRRVEETVEAALAFNPDAAVLIDSWGFTLRVAQRLRERAPHIKLVKYVGPQVFATRPGRAKTLAATVDHLLTIHSFDSPFFMRQGLETTFVGNPTLERELSGDGAGFRERSGIAPDAPVLALLIGSRPSELKRMYDALAGAADILLQERPDLRIVIPLAGPIEEAARARLSQDARLADAVLIDETEKADAFAAADLALATSGTVTTELATLGVPTVTGYRVGWITWALARALNLFKAKYISLVNIAADAELIPEFVQTRCTPALLAEETGRLLDAPEERVERADRLRATTQAMCGPGRASARAAETVLQLLSA
jgi:lipid-A-disaccharide synthase